MGMDTALREYFFRIFREYTCAQSSRSCSLRHSVNLRNIFIVVLNKEAK